MDYCEIIDSFVGKKILAIGDVMLDEYIIGDAERISPEAPIPIIAVKERQFALGGAANTANNATTLGAKVTLLGVIGKRESDSTAVLTNLLEEKKITNHCITDETRHTTRKTRIIAGHQQMLRIDEEKTTVISKAMEDRLLDVFTKEIKNSDAVIVSDYAKGVFTPRLSREIMRIARQEKKIVCVDSKQFRFFKNATLAKPNRKELEKETGKKCPTMEECEKAALLFCRKNHAETLLLTLGEEGMLLVEGKEMQRIKSSAIEVYDVSGAGDTVLAAASLALASGATTMQAAKIANFAAGVVIRKLGTATVTAKELKEEITHG